MLLIISSIDRKTKPRVTLNKAISNLYKMKQAGNEANGSYLERSRYNGNIVVLAQGEHIWCSKAIMKKEATLPTTQEITEEEQHTKIVFFSRT